MITETTDKYIKHYAEDGMVLTEWVDGDDITNFAFAKVAICPLNKDCNWREITEEAAEILQAEQDAAVRDK